MIRCKVFGIATMSVVVVSTPAYAYLDPGTGSILAQAAIGAVVAAGVFARTWWTRLQTLFGRRKPRPNEMADGD